MELNVLLYVNVYYSLASLTGMFSHSLWFQLTCARLLEILPVVFEKLQLSFHELSGSSVMMVENIFDFKWLLDLMDWGKSRVQVIARYWRQTVISLLRLLKGSCSDTSASFIRAIENLISRGELILYFEVVFYSSPQNHSPHLYFIF